MRLPWGTEEELLTVHGYEERRWRHLDTMQFETIIAARVPRVRHEDGHTEMVRAPWAEPQSRWTLMFEGFALRVLEHSRSVSRAAELLRLDWSSAQRIMDAGCGARPGAAPTRGRAASGGG
jgi:transposase